MNQCQNCGQVNSHQSNFCRFCGTKFIPNQQSNGANYEFSPPRPYVWKTDEFQISESKAKKTQQINFQNQPQQVQPLGNQFQPNPYSQPLLRQPSQIPAQAYRCPRCSSQFFPAFERKTSTLGWIIFTVMLFSPLIFFCWLGLFIKEDVRVCPVCRLTYG